MKRIFFTKWLEPRILSGEKVLTTRDHFIHPGEYEACTGTWRNPKTIEPFAVIRIFAVWKNTMEGAKAEWKREGFISIEEMNRFLHQTGLQRYARAPQLWTHEFKLRKILGPNPEITLQS